MNANGVPIVGQSTHVNFCPRGHRELSTGPFHFMFPGADGRPQAQPVCRICLLEWFTWTMPVQSLPLAKFEQVTGARLLADGTWSSSEEQEGGPHGTA